MAEVLVFIFILSSPRSMEQSPSRQYLHLFSLLRYVTIILQQNMIDVTLTVPTMNPLCFLYEKLVCTGNIEFSRETESDYRMKESAGRGYCSVEIFENYRT